jgi:Zn-finger nucleic acid-binding protein
MVAPTEAERHVLTCPRCGGPLPPAAAHEAVTCAFCGATSAPEPEPFVVMQTIQVVSPDATAGRATREATVTTLPCPRCSVFLYRAAVADVFLAGCGSCGGIWIDSKSVRVATSRVDARIGQLAGTAASNAKRSADTRPLVPCPVCKRTLERVELQRAGVAVDFCAAHGTWFDRSELGRVLDAVRAKHEAELRSFEPYAREADGRPVATQLADAAKGIIGLVGHILEPE